MSARDNKPHCYTQSNRDRGFNQILTKVVYDLTKAEAAYRLAKIQFFTNSSASQLTIANLACRYQRADAKREGIRDIAINLLRICMPMPPVTRRALWRAARAGYRGARIVIHLKGGGL